MSLSVGRLAPSPTGAQHVGNARTYLLAWLAIRSRGGRMILRMEDIDSPRVKPWAAAQAIDDLRWLGLDWDEGPDIGGPHGPYVQTQRLDHYATALEQLKAGEQIYPCTCTRSDVAAAASAPHAGQEGPIYPGTCAGRSAADAVGLTVPYCWRWRTSGGRGPLEFHDAVAGEQRCNLSRELGDFVVCKHDGTPSYQLAVVLDDHAMGVNEVLRGDDLIPSTFRQLAIYDFFGWPAPGYAHAPLVVGPDGRRLAKRHGDTRISILREAGQGPERLVGLLAWSCGLRPTAEPVTARDLQSDFELARLPKERFVLTEEHWKSICE
ncbi:tRNA glutamyl-Q(34) synthetase GluQRS [Planctellipticum variicoloris]|uniref:tRNA glutamyl-Q(34) synthetase GluQRS n=1 Tax=Planctellipticum variicoloris TaxID=3064265 RepID=UPI003013ACFF|nr:tRNA glutamyl-Q(34) synthetase GluQRS [Planctomycetaceae bacterium SH412]